jgi:ADP-L-glycero-D-manno-heptose 6-epimerase
VIIVTGAAGFIGSNLVLALNQLGRSDIVVVDNLRNASKHRNLNCARFADYVAKEDLFDALPSLGAVDAIFHQGACSDTTESDGQYMLKNNYDYSKRLLQFAQDSGAKFIYASSAAVYGDGANGFYEQAACEYPLNVYGFSKLLFDNYVRARIARSPAQIVGLRYFNVYGPQERHKGRMASVAMHLFDQLQAASSMRLFDGSAEFKRDFIHVDDVVAINLFFLQNSASGIFNCGSGSARSFVDVAQALRERHGAGNIEYTPFPQDLVGKYQRYTQADLQQLRAAGCQHAGLTLEQGLTRYYDVLKQSGGYKRTAN